MVKQIERGMWDKFWRDADGKVAVWQTPNLPLMVWVAGTLGLWFFDHGWVHRLLDTLTFGAIFTWTYLEIRFGASYFRRLLGVIILIIVIKNRL